MNRRTRWAQAASTVATITLVLTASACNDRARAMQHYAELACKTSTDDAVMVAAVRGFVAQVHPKPMRFVYIPATDSAPPDAMIETVKHLGPTYLYSTIPAQQAVVYKQLETVGDYTTLLLAYHGYTRKDPLHPVVTMSGVLISGEDSGQVIPKRDLALKCDTTGWVVPPPPKDTTSDTTHVVITKHARLRPQ